MTTTQFSAPEAATASGTYTLRNVRAVLDDQIVENASISVIDGLIADIDAGGATSAISLDGHNLLALPGLVDLHSDGLEKEAKPRRTSTFPFDYAIGAFEGRLRSSGVTTVFHGVGYQSKPRAGRSVDAARELNAVIAERQRDSGRMVDHRVLYRFEARDAIALDPLLADLDAGDLGSTPIISFEDHTPGQGQYRDVSQYEAALSPDEVPEGHTIQTFVQHLMAEAEVLLVARDDNLARLAPLAKSGQIRLLFHDPEMPDDVAMALEAGASIAEFPVSLGAAAHARELGMSIVMGAPNALRGASHNGNASARELVAAGLCDALASDYLPPAMLASAMVLATTGCCSLFDAVRLISSGPAAMAGLDDRGKLEVGRRADMILVDDRRTWPVVAGVRRASDALNNLVFG